MTFSLLLDLDDTLLDTNIDSFIPAYFKKLAGHMAPHAAPDKFINALLKSTQIMYGSTRTDRTLEQVFSENFYPDLDTSRENLAAEIDRFYDEVFPSLSSLTTPRPEAVELVQWAFSKGWNVAVATDPLFPRKAIDHRLRWAGLAPEQYPFTLVSDFQNFHFAKASVAYYPEFLAKMNWVDGPVLMVGDSLERDVVPSQQAGVPIYWLDNSGTRRDGIESGWYRDLQRYLENTDLDTLKVDYSSTQAIIAFLQAAPGVMHNYVMRYMHENKTSAPRDGGWSMLEILCHLRDCDKDLFIPRAEAILREDRPTLHGVNTEPWVLERDYAGLNIQQVFAEYVENRKNLVSLLLSISADDWNRQAFHTESGPTSLYNVMLYDLNHDRDHFQQSRKLYQL